jgi:membrane protein
MAETGSKESLGKRIARWIAWGQATRPGRVFLYYIELRGGLLGSGLAYAAIFAVFAGLWVGFAIAGIVISGNVGLQEALLQFIDASIPGLIAVDGGPGAIDPAVLLDATIFGWTGIVASVALLVTAVNWLASARDAVRIMLGMPPIRTNFLLLKLGDLGLTVVFGAVLLVSAALSVVGTQATGLLLGLVGIEGESVIGTVTGRIVSLAVMFALDTVLLAGVYRVLSHVRVPLRRVRNGALLAAGACGVLKVLASASLISAGSTNPLVSSFAVIFGLLVFFNLICQVIVIGAAWVAIEVQDHGIVLDTASDVGGRS